jgi:Glutathione S-transferase, C-terminal domain
MLSDDCRICCSALKNFDILEETLSDGRKYLVNNEFSVADISVGYAVQTLKMLQVSHSSTPNASCMCPVPAHEQGVPCIQKSCHEEACWHLHSVSVNKWHVQPGGHRCRLIT